MCIYICVYKNIYIDIHSGSMKYHTLYSYIYMHHPPQGSIYIYIHIYIYIYIYVCIYIFMYMYVSMYINIHRGLLFNKGQLSRRILWWLLGPWCFQKQLSRRCLNICMYIYLYLYIYIYMYIYICIYIYIYGVS
jgi:hypothetical protein